MKQPIIYYNDKNLPVLSIQWNDDHLQYIVVQDGDEVITIFNSIYDDGEHYIADVPKLLERGGQDELRRNHSLGRAIG